MFLLMFQILKYGIGINFTMKIVVRFGCNHTHMFWKCCKCKCELLNSWTVYSKVKEYTTTMKKDLPLKLVPSENCICVPGQNLPVWSVLRWWPECSEASGLGEPHGVNEGSPTLAATGTSYPKNTENTAIPYYFLTRYLSILYEWIAGLWKDKVNQGMRMKGNSKRPEQMITGHVRYQKLFFLEIMAHAVRRRKK